MRSPNFQIAILYTIGLIKTPLTTLLYMHVSLTTYLSVSEECIIPKGLQCLFRNTGCLVFPLYSASIPWFCGISDTLQ